MSGRVLLVVGAVLLAACTSRGGGLATSGRSPSSSEAPERPARIRVTQIPKSGGAFFTEGSVSYVVLQEGEAVVFRKAFRNPPSLQPLIDLEPIPPGRYRLLSYERPCDGSCGALDPPTGRCFTALDLDAAEHVVVTIQLRVPERCTMDVEPAAEIGTPYPFRLYTHCGFGPIFFDGRAWVPHGYPDGGALNSPPGWGDPYQAGTIELLREDVLRFTSQTGRSLRFTLPPSDQDITLPGCY